MIKNSKMALLKGEILDVFSVEENFSAVEGERSRDRFHKHSLSRTCCAQDGEDFAGFYAQVQENIDAEVAL